MNRVTHMLVALTTATLPQGGMAQAEEDLALAVVYQLFDGMRLGDSSMVAATFAPNARMVSAGPDGIRFTRGQDFARLVASPHDSIWDEQIWDPEVKVEGPLATVWTKYAFFRGTQFSHCGIDAFQLTKLSGEWKIIHLADTRQQEGCELPPGY